MVRESLLDTDILSETLKRKNPVVLQYPDAYSKRHREFTLSAVSVHEVVYGLVRKQTERQLREAREVFVDNKVVLPTLDDYERAATIRGEAWRRGRVLSFPDCLVGATAERLGLPIATGNLGHFQAMVDAGLAVEIEDWRGPGLLA